MRPNVGYHPRHGISPPDSNTIGTPNINRGGKQDIQLKIGKGEILGIAIGSACAFFLLAAFVYLAYRYVANRRKTQSEYEKILPTKSTSPGPGDPKSVHVPNMSMRTIPFTVPSTGAGPGRARATDQRLLSDQDTLSTGSGSEPTTPSNPAKRGSLDSLASTGTDIRGAYALGTIDPSLYRTNEEDDDYDFADDHIGRVWFAVEYELESEKLKVDVIKARNLPSRVVSSVTGCDPFVRIYLMPDERRYLQTKCKKKTCNPKFEESFVFQVSSKALEERTLKVTLFDVDRHKRHNVIGHALYALKEHAYDSNERVFIWRDLEREVSETTSDKGDLHVSLSYNNHMERLTVSVFEGKNLKKAEGSSTEEFYVKVCLLQQSKVLKAKRTDVIKRTLNPIFNESFTFKLANAHVDTTSISISAFQHLTGQKDKPIGRIVLGSFMFARGKELDHWNEMLANLREQVSQWYTLT